MKEHKATLRYLRMAPRKVRLVASLLKGLSVNEAEAQLLLMRQRAAQPILKLLRSAVVGAKAKHFDVQKLVVGSVRADQGPMLKRYLPRAMGRATPIQKKMSHVMLTLEERESASPRFVMTVRKKIKPELRKSAGKEPGDREKEAERAQEKKTSSGSARRGFLKKIFSRKSV